MISVLVPSRGRPERCRAMCSSALARARGPVEILVGLDVDDDVAAYMALFDPSEPVRLKAFGLGFGVSRIWNLLAAESRGSLLLMGNDDQEYATDGWDLRFAQEAARYPDGVFVLWCDDGINGERHAAFPCVSRRWVDALGYFAPEKRFGFFYNDTWIYDIGFRLGRLRYLPDVLVRHAHWTVGGLDDETTRRNRTSDLGVKDRQAWEATAHVRESEAGKLRARMRAERLVRT